MVRPSGASVSDEDRVRVVTTDYLATGADGLFGEVTPRGGFTVESDVGAARDVVVDALRKRGGTLRANQLVDATHPRWEIPGPPPVTCGR
jgi:hypothetical protein